MLRLIFFTAAMLVCAADVPARAEDWIFARSYYSHQLPAPVDYNHRPPGGPFYTRQQGEFVRSGFRNVRSSIVVGGRLGGRSFDHAQFYESWIQVGGQF